MLTTEIIVYFLVIMISLGTVIALGFKWYFVSMDMESRISGIWSNGENTMRVLIYSLNSQFQGEVVWTESGKHEVLGKEVIQDMRLNFFGWSKGTYIDPVTENPIRVRLKLKKSGRLCFRFLERPPHHSERQEEWRLVR